jgi:hypothetical protein
MKIVIRDYLGCNYIIECVSDDTIGVIVEQYKKLRCDPALDESQYQYVVRGSDGVVVLDSSDLLQDLGLSDESTLRIDMRRMMVEFQSIDFENEIATTCFVPPLLPTPTSRPRWRERGPTAPVTREETGPVITNHDDYYTTRLSALANDGWEIVDINYWKRTHPPSKYPIILFKRKV